MRVHDLLRPFGVLAAVMVLSASPADADEDAAAKLQAALKGTWVSVCMDVGGGVFIKTTSTYDGAGKSDDVVRFYSDAACTKPTGLVKTNSSTYELGKKVDLGEGGGDLEAFAIDITITKWELKQGDAVVNRGGAVPKQYDIIAIDGDTFYTSGLSRAKKGPITDPAERPKTLDRKNVFKKH